MGECVIYEGARPTGRLEWRSDGLRWHFQAKLGPYEGVRYLWLTDPRGGRLRLGVPQPVGDGMALERTLTRQGLGGFAPGDACDAQLSPGDGSPVNATESGTHRAVTPEAEQSAGTHGPEQVRIFREHGRLYVGEPFRAGAALCLNAVFRRMELMETDDGTYWRMEIT